jgi:hypothetical protein
MTLVWQLLLWPLEFVLWCALSVAAIVAWGFMTEPQILFVKRGALIFGCLSAVTAALIWLGGF